MRRGLLLSPRIGRRVSRRRCRGGGGPARGRGCDAPVVFFRSPFTGNPRTFDPKPVEPSDPRAGATAFPIFSGRAHRPGDLVDVLMPLRECTASEAEAEIQDLPWHLIHECPPDTKDTP